MVAGASVQIIRRLTFLCLVLYGVTFYGGIRSPDGEVVYRTAESLALRGTFAVDEELPWRQFGLPPGLDGKRYSIFGPTMSLAAVPFVLVGDRLADLGWFQGREQWLRNNYAGRRSAHELAIRFVANTFNIFATTLLVILVFLWLQRLTASPAVAEACAYVFAFASPFFPYASYFFSETLCAVFVVASLWSVTSPEPLRPRQFALAGFLLGLAVTVHITAILFAPFLALMARPWPIRPLKRWVPAITCFVAGLAPAILALGVYNWSRFGNPLETGRTVEMIYAEWEKPWLGLYGLLVGPSKGFFWHFPLAVVAVVCAFRLPAKYRPLMLLMAAAAVARVVVIASRTDWAAGFCVGPRYLLLLVPLFVVPMALKLNDLRLTPRLRIVFCAAFWAAALQQYFLSTADVFLYLYRTMTWADANQIPRLNAYYLDWATTSLLYVHDYGPSPLLLKSWSPPLYATLLIGGALLLVPTWFLARALDRHGKALPTPS